MKTLTPEEQLLILAYAGTQTGLRNFLKKHTDLSQDIKERAAAIYACSSLIFEMEQTGDLPVEEMYKYFPTKEVVNFFGSLLNGKEDDPRDIRLITVLVQNLNRQTNMGEGVHRDFLPFTAFQWNSWLELILRIQKTDQAPQELKKEVNEFIDKLPTFILQPGLTEYQNDLPLQFFSLFEKFDFPDKEKVVRDGMATWKEYERSGYDSLKEKHNENWAKAALEFAVRLTSKEYVSKLFAENLKLEYSELYEKFRVLVNLDECVIDVPQKKAVVSDEKLLQKELSRLFGEYECDVEKFAQVVSSHEKTKELSGLMFDIMTNVAYGQYEKMRKVAMSLVKNHKDSVMVSVLTSLFTKNVNEKIETGVLGNADLPPDPGYIDDPKLQWIVEFCYN